MNPGSTIYAPDMTLREARTLYFRRSSFGEDGGYSERWIKVKVWRVPIWLPNTAGRVRAVKLHDLHHVLTEYPTTWSGEAEISSWEIGAGGLKRYYAGWILDLMNMAQGLVVNPRGIYRGFMRGRRSENLFGMELTDELLDEHVGDFRGRLRLNDPSREPTTGDRAAFLFWIFASVLTYLIAVSLPFVPVLLLVLPIVWL